MSATTALAGLIAAALSAGLADEPVILVTGETIHGEIVESNDDRIIIDHALFGRLEIPRDQVASVGEPAETVTEVEEAAEAEPAPEPVDDDPIPPEWKSTFQFGFSSSTGNTDTQDVQVAVLSERKTDRMETDLDARYFWGATNGDDTTNKFTAGIDHQWLVPEEAWFYFADARYDYDAFNSWEQRISGHGGIGYYLVDDDDLSFSVRAGFGAAKEINSKRNQLIPEALLGADLEWTIDDKQSLTASSRVYPDLDETGELRAVNSLAWNYLMDERNNMSLTLGAYHEYQSQVDPGVEENDLKIYGGLSFNF
ncbi:MAG: YdiY family protein [Phycisphaerales bacterium]